MAETLQDSLIGNPVDANDGGGGTGSYQISREPAQVPDPVSVQYTLIQG